VPDGAGTLLLHARAEDLRLIDTLRLVLSLAALMSTAFLFAWMRPAVIVRHRRIVLAALAVVTVAALVAVARPHAPGAGIRLDPSEEPLLPAVDSARDVYADAIANFGDDDVMVIGMETTDVFTAEHLETLRRISEAIRRLPGVRSVESLIDATAFRYDRAEDVLRVEPFIDTVPHDATALDALRQRALVDRLYPRSLVGRDGRTAALNVSFRTMTDGAFVDAGIDESIAAILGAETTPERRFFVTGRQHVKARAADIMLHDVFRLIPLAVVVGTLVAWLITGSLRATAIPVGASLVATLWTFGVLAVAGQTLNLITIVLGPMLICIGSVYGVHVLARYDVLARELGDAARAAEACIADTALPVMISGVTAIIGFAALFVAPQPAIGEFACYSIFGIAAMSLIAVTGVPAVAASLPLPGAHAAGTHFAARMTGAASSFIARVLDRLATLTTRHATPILVAWLGITLGTAVMIPSIVVNTDYLTFFDPRSDVRRDFARANERLVGAVPVYLMLTGPGEGAFREPENLRVLERLQRLVDAVPGVDTTLSVVDLVAVMNRAIERDEPAAERVPDTREEIANLLLLVPKAKLRRFANTNHSRVNLLIRTSESGSAAVAALRSRLEGAIAAARLPAGITATVTGNTIVFTQASDGIAGNQLTAMVLTTVSILTLVAVSLRSLPVGLVAMAPNVAPVVIFFGLLGAGIAELSLPTSLIGSVALGIATDDTSHFIVNYQRMRRGGLDSGEAAAACMREMGPPIVTETIMLTAGYLVLCLSGFATLRQFGWLSALTVQICLVGDLVMLPALLTRTRV